jgi:hypothetical protein
MFSSTLSITTVGGTFAGWASLEHNGLHNQSLEVIPGRIRIRPFLRALHAQTTVLDALIVPGAVPVDDMTVRMSALWMQNLQPVAPEDVRPTLIPARHFTVFDTVSATITLELLLGESRTSNSTWTCSFSTQVQLVSRDETLPPLWGLASVARGSGASDWIALYDQTSGPIRAFFADPASAEGFARWLRETNATHAGQYRLGMSGPESEFRALNFDDVRTVRVSRPGER